MDTPVDLSPVLIRAFDAWLTIALCENFLADFGPSHEANAHRDMAAMANEQARRIAQQLEGYRA